MLCQTSIHLNEILVHVTQKYHLEKGPVPAPPANKDAYVEDRLTFYESACHDWGILKVYSNHYTQNRHWDDGIHCILWLKNSKIISIFVSKNPEKKRHGCRW